MSIADIPTASATLPPLQPGDRMNRFEFERRYHAMPDCKKAELVEGVVYVPSPARLRHGQLHALVMGWIVNYSIATSGTECADNATNRLDNDNEPQPDVALFIDPVCGGQSRISDDGYLTGPVEFVAEISVSSVSLDRGPKLRTYERHGVKEYLIWRVEDNLLEWYALRETGFELQPLPDDGIYRSETFPGLWLNSAAMLGMNGKTVMQTLGDGLGSADHADFVRRLASRRMGDSSSS
ncbi:MAG: Uma2 family endonuclease [Planctomycetaceae bacterium]